MPFKDSTTELLRNETKVQIELLSLYCDESVNKERRDEGPERRNEGTNDRNEGTGNEKLLWPRPNSVSGTGNDEPPCVDMGGRVTLYLDV